MRRSPATFLLELWFRIPPGSWLFVSYECFVLSDRDLCEGPISRPEESYWICVFNCVCDLEISTMRWPRLRNRDRNDYFLFNP